MAERALHWAYGVIPDSQPAPARVAGIEGRPIEPVVQNGLAVLASAVPSDRFSGDELQQRLDDLQTLGELARAHDAVLEAALEDGDVVPFRMCTLYETPQAIREMLGAEADRFAALLARLHDKAEWGVKAFLAPRAEAAPAARPSSGTEYLTRRLAQREAAEASGAALEAAVAGVHVELAERAAAAVMARPQDRRLSGRDAEMVLNGAYLVARDDARAFAGHVDALRRRHEDDGLILELTGPWPPYHFVREGSA